MNVVVGCVMWNGCFNFFFTSECLAINFPFTNCPDFGTSHSYYNFMCEYNLSWYLSPKQMFLIFVPFLLLCCSVQGGSTLNYDQWGDFSGVRESVFPGIFPSRLALLVLSLAECVCSSGTSVGLCIITSFV